MTYPSFVGGVPGLQSAVTGTPNDPLFSTEGARYLPNGKVVDGAKSRDPLSTGDVGTLAGGLIMGAITSGGKLRPSIIGLSNGALTSTGTTLTVTAATATELARLLAAGATTFKLTGPPTAAGTVRSATVTYSAASGTSVTITAVGVNEVQTVAFGAAATGGTFKIGFTLASGAVVWTDTIAWSATDATFLSNINAAIDNVLGSTLVVATAISATDTDLGFVLTFSGAGYTALPQTLVSIDAAALTSVSTVTVTRTTTGVDGRFVTASLIQPADGAETPVCVQGDQWGLYVLDDNGASADTEIPKMLIAGILDTGKVRNWPADTSLITWLKAQLNLIGPFSFAS